MSLIEPIASKLMIVVNVVDVGRIVESAVSAYPNFRYLKSSQLARVIEECVRENSALTCTGVGVIIRIRVVAAGIA